MAIETREQAPRDKAVQRLKKRRDFRAHLLVYVLVNGFVVLIWAITGSGFFWPVFPMAAWGIGLVLNAWDVYWRREITEQDIRHEMEREDRRGAAARLFRMEELLRQRPPHAQPAPDDGQDPQAGDDLLSVITLRSPGSRPAEHHALTAPAPPGESKASPADLAGSTPVGGMSRRLPGVARVARDVWVL